MKSTLSLVLISLCGLLATQARAVPAVMTEANIVTGQGVFPSPMPSLMVADHSVVELLSTRGSTTALNLTCRFQTVPVFGLLARRVNVVVVGFSRAPVTIEGFNQQTHAWSLMGTVRLPTNLTRVTLGFPISSPQMAARFIDLFGQMLVRLRRSDTRQFGVIMDCLGVNVLYS